MWRIAITLAVEVMMITASTSRKLPNVSWPIESENGRFMGDFGGNSGVMLLRPGSKRPQYTTVFRPRGNMLKARPEQSDCDRGRPPWNWPVGAPARRQSRGH